LLDSVLLLVSGIIGSSIFLTAKDIAGPLPNPTLFFLVWVLGGVISLCACVAFAELGSMFPDSGGQYIYLREAYGDLVAFLYGWMLFAVANGGTIAALSVASAAYMGNIIPAISQEHVPSSPTSTLSDCAGAHSCRISPPGRSSPPWPPSLSSDSPSARDIGRTSVRTRRAG
jgi:APA family basic amino acid/polyamine antiporter